MAQFVANRCRTPFMSACYGKAVLPRTAWVRVLRALVGAVHYRRASYLCRRCGQGLFPFDRRAGLTDRDLTPGLERTAALAGAVADSFEKGAALIEEKGPRGHGPRGSAAANSCPVGPWTAISLWQHRRLSRWNRSPEAAYRSVSGRV
jgi:hypothetical protein